VSRGSSAFRQADLARAVKALRAAGVGVVRVEIERDKITIVAGKPGETEQENSMNSWDEVSDRAAH
jgi:hypothetical protein